MKSLIAGYGVLAIFLMCGCESPHTGSLEPSEDVLVISNVKIVDVQAKKTDAAKDLIISEGRITEIRDHVGGVDGAFDAQGAYVVAGLYDAHVHIDTSARIELMLPEIFGTKVSAAEIDDDLAPYVAFGITSVVVLNGNQEVLDARERAQEMGAFRPRIVAASPILDGPETENSGHRAIATPTEGRAAVNDALAAGYDLIKTYHIADKKTRDAIIARAAELGMTVVGHLPPGMPFEDAIVPGFANVAHAEEITRNWDGEDKQYLANAIDLMAKYDVSLTPNLVAYREIADEISDIKSHLATKDWELIPPLARVYSAPPFNGYVEDFGGDDIRERAAAYFRRIGVAMDELTLNAHQRGVMLLAGTDAGNPTMFPGQGLYRELSLLRAAGLDGYDVLAAATLNVAKLTGEEAERGSIEVGKIADLVLFRVNPVGEEILTRESVWAVVKNGELFDQGRISSEIDRISANFDEREIRYKTAALAKSPASNLHQAE